MKIYFAFSVILFLAGAGFGQNSPVVKQTGKSVEAINLRGGQIKNLKCAAKTFTVAGTVVNRNFEDDETTIDNFIVRGERGGKTKIYLNVEHLRRLGENSAITINSLIANGRKVKVRYAQCSNGSHSFNVADQITAF